MSLSEQPRTSLTVRFTTVPQLKEKLAAFQALFETIPEPYLKDTGTVELFTYGYKPAPVNFPEPVRIIGIGYKTIDVQEGKQRIKLEIDNSGDQEYTIILVY